MIISRYTKICIYRLFYAAELRDALAPFIQDNIMETEKLQIRIQKRNRDKFKPVLLYVLSKVGEQLDICETVLHSLLYFIDFDYYEIFEETLMGETYIKNCYGPTSKDLNKVLRKMQKQNIIAVKQNPHHQYPRKTYSLLKIPDFDVLSDQEKIHIDEVLTRISNKSAKDLESYSHGDIPWKSAQFGEPISYESVFYRDEGYSVKNYDDEI